MLQPNPPNVKADVLEILDSLSRDLTVDIALAEAAGDHEALRRAMELKLILVRELTALRMRQA